MLDFPRPLKLPNPVWLAVLSVKEGEALWPLDDSPPAIAAGCLYSQDDANWLPRSETEDKKLWAPVRLRLQDTELKPSVAISVRRGGKSVDLQPDGEGRIRADAQALSSLNAADEEVLEIQGSAPCSGRLILSDLRVVYQ